MAVDPLIELRDVTIQSGRITIEGQPLPEEGRALAKARRRKKEQADRRSRELLDRALAMEPKTLLFDEPTPALDPEMTNEVLEVTRQLARDGMTMVVGTHEMGFAHCAAHRVVFMADGRTVEDRAPEEFLTAPRGERARDFLAKILKH
ncbi:hypothetical protein ABTY98_30515 [Streptomyces sp. NPDC096040]|uniref:hypothetical protein n=1 Tax=Streptomyces sp. NPDC096040 TaxID=3155541 RepID=UPI003317B1DD